MGIFTQRGWFLARWLGTGLIGSRFGGRRHGAGGRGAGSARGRCRHVVGLESLEGRAVMTAVIPTYTVTQNWGSGFQGQVQLANKDVVAVPNWTVQFDLAANLTSVWDGAVVSHVGTRYTITNAGWNATLPVGGTVGIGFVATPGSTGPSTPTNWLLNGQPLTAIPTGTGSTGTTTGTGTTGTGTTGTTTGTTGTSAGTTPTTGTIGTLAFAVTTDWGSGFNGEVKITNTSAGTLTNWRATFDFAGQIGSIWNGSIESHVGNRYVVKPSAWNDNLAAGTAATIGFGGTPGGASAKITLVSLTGTVTTAPTGTGGTTSGGSTSGGGGTGTTTGTTTTGGTTTATLPAPLTPAAATVWGSHASAPYVDMTLYPMVDLAGLVSAASTRHYTLAFITADPSGKPAWGGYAEYGVNSGGDYETKLRGAIVGVRQAGGDVSVSFGGAAGIELAQKLTDVTALKNAYRSVVDAYGLRRIDFDIEGAAVAEPASVERRWQAVAAMQKDLAVVGRAVDVWVTLPVLPQGLTVDGVAVLKSAVKNGVSLAGVNVMAMDYGSWAAPNPSGKMGDYAIQAAASTFAQMQGVYGATKTDTQLWSMIGITPMIGVNDVTTEVFDQTEAREVVAFAQQRKIGMLGFWSINRDVAGTRFTGQAAATDSGIVQTAFDFAKIFAAFDA
ncbi:MAG: cellulose binding domain-containing protein [Planctomycetia bacterium]